MAGGAGGRDAKLGLEEEICETSLGNTVIHITI